MRKISKLVMVLLMVLAVAAVVPQMGGTCDTANSQDRPCS